NPHAFGATGPLSSRSGGPPAPVFSAATECRAPPSDVWRLPSRGSRRPHEDDRRQRETERSGHVSVGESLWAKAARDEPGADKGSGQGALNLWGRPGAGPSSRLRGCNRPTFHL